MTNHVRLKKKEEQNNVVREEYVHVNSHKFDNTLAQGLWLDHQTYQEFSDLEQLLMLGHHAA